MAIKKENIDNVKFAKPSLDISFMFARDKDIDNCVKPILDAVALAEVVKNDKEIELLRLTKKKNIFTDKLDRITIIIQGEKIGKE